MKEDDQRLTHADLSLLETLDHVLNRGLVIAGEVVVSVADIDLLYVGLNVLVGSVETINQVLDKSMRAGGAGGPAADEPADQ